MITSKFIDKKGIEYTFEYHECDDFNDLPQERVKQVYGVCFTQPDKIVLGFGWFGGHEKSWGLIGGSIEKGETIEETFTREIQEESNMKVLDFTPIGYQKVTTEGKEPIYELRVSAKVEPFGDFVEDPMGGITEIKIVDVKEYKNYFDWGEIGDAIIKRGYEISSKFFK